MPADRLADGERAEHRDAAEHRDHEQADAEIDAADTSRSALAWALRCSAAAISRSVDFSIRAFISPADFDGALDLATVSP